MTIALITVDTELSELFQQRGVSARENFNSSIYGVCGAGAFGIGWQMDRLECHGLRGVFFVDPLPALVYGETLIADIVGPVLARGHDIQLHIHTEWLNWAKSPPVEARGRNLADFSLNDQIVLLREAADILERAGAPRPIAFRAGNFGADDNSLRALSAVGLRWDSSFNASLLGTPCRITLSPEQTAPREYLGMLELPVSGIWDKPGHIRPAQVCAMSTREMRAALSHAADSSHAVFVVVTHSFEMLSRDRLRPNRSVMARFESMCRTIAENPNITSSCFAKLDPSIVDANGRREARLAPNLWRTGLRMIEQTVATWVYERRLRPD